MTAPRQEASKLGQFSWALFDWANQPFFTIVTTFIFAPYFANVMVGDPVAGQAAWAFTQSTSGILIALMSPFLGAMADAGGRRKPYIFVFQILLVLGCASLWFAYPGRPDLVGPISAAVVHRHHRRRDVDRVQQLAASPHRAARAHGLAERLRLGHGLLRRPGRAVRRAGRQHAGDVRAAANNDVRCSAWMPGRTSSSA